MLRGANGLSIFWPPNLSAKPPPGDALHSAVYIFTLFKIVFAAIPADCLILTSQDFHHVETIKDSI